MLSFKELYKTEAILIHCRFSVGMKNLVMPDESPKLKRTNPWSWVPTLYFAEGIPYTVVTVLSVVMYKMLGISNTKIAFYTSLLNLPWALKPIWGPIVDNLKTKRWWILTMQFIMGILFACIALTIPTDYFFQVSFALLWLVAFMSATHDVAADGFYMIGLDEGDQALYNGIRSAFYRIAMLMGQGVFVIFVSILINASGMDKITIEVNAVPAENKIESIQVKSEDIQPKAGDLHLISVPKELNIPMKPVKPKYVDSVLHVVRRWNKTQGHFKAEDSEKNQKMSQPEPIREVHTSRLETWLRKTFGAAKKVGTDYAGNVGIIYFYLSRPPEEGENIVVTFGQDRGDPSIRLVEGMRFEFDQNNWNKPARAVIQLDKKLQESSTAYFDAESGNIRMSWMILFLIIAAMFLTFWIIHRLTLEKIEKERLKQSVSEAIRDFFATFKSFFTKRRIGLSILFLLIFRLGESQLVKLSAPFMLDTREVGGLGLTAGQYGLTYGTIGLIFLLSGGILGGMAVSKFGLKKMIWWFAIMINVPNAAYIFLSYVQPSSLPVIISAVAFETFGYGFGFTAYMMYMIYISKGKYKTSHYAICTAFMNLGMMLPGMMSGWLQEIIGYQHFFIWVVLASIPGFILIKFLSIDREFGKKFKKTR